jgi:hypothetical protein
VGRFSATTCGKIFSILIVQDTINLAGQMLLPPVIDIDGMELQRKGNVSVSSVLFFISPELAFHLVI